MYTYKYIRTWICTHIYLQYAHLCIYTYTEILKKIKLYTSIHFPKCVFVYTHIHIHFNTGKYIYMYIYAYAISQDIRVPVHIFTIWPSNSVSINRIDNDISAHEGIYHCLWGVSADYCPWDARTDMSSFMMCHCRFLSARYTNESVMVYKVSL